MKTTMHRTERCAVLRRKVAACAAALLMAAAGTQAQDTAAIQTVTVYFGGACAKGVDTPVLETTLSPPGQVRWVADGGAEVDFTVYFSPFSGDVIKGVKGKTEVKVITDVPRALFKYTILGDNCPDEPVDPYVRVH